MRATGTVGPSGEDEADRHSIGTRPPPLIAAFLNVQPQRLRDWTRRGLIGRTCDVQTKIEGFDILDVMRMQQKLGRRRPRVALADDAWIIHTAKGLGIPMPGHGPRR